MIYYQVLSNALHSVELTIHLAVHQKNFTKGAFTDRIYDLKVLEVDYFFIFHLAVQGD